jgi:hypothetical protein
MEEVGINWWIWHMFVWPCPFIRREWLVQSGPDDRCADRSVIQFSETFSWINELNVKRRILESEHVRQEHFLYVHSCAGITRQKGFIEWVWQGLFFYRYGKEITDTWSNKQKWYFCHGKFYLSSIEALTRFEILCPLVPWLMVLHNYYNCVHLIYA